MYSPSRILRLLNLSQNQANFSQELTNFCNCRKVSADFGLRRVPWRHRNVHSVKERLFLSLKKWNEQPCVLFTSDLQELSYIGQPNWTRNKSALLVWATDRLSAQAGAADCSRSCDTVIHSAGRYSEESSRIHRRILLKLRYQKKHHWCGNQEKHCSINTNLHHSPWI